MQFVWNTTSGLMAVTACSAVTLAAYLAFDSGTGSPFLGLILILASAVGVAALRAAESIHRRRTDGERLTARLRVTIILRSAGVAALIVGLADLAFLMTYAFFGGSVPILTPRWPPSRYDEIVPARLMLGTVAGLGVCYLSRRAFWGPIPSRGRLIRRLAPIAVVSLLLGANLMLRRIEYRLKQAGWHETLSGEYGGESRLPPAPPPPGFGPRRDPDLAAYHMRMRRKWERAASRPWLPVEPDPPPPDRKR